MEYNFKEIEEKCRKRWKENNVYKVSNDSSKPKYYVLDMFPYPSGAGLHVGHPLGYIASDIFARYKKLKGYNVLHPMGYDAFGLPAEQYAIEHGIHPAVSTEQNINNFRNQLDKIGFCFDWDREIRTSDPKYYKWTQWIFLQLFNSYYNRSIQKAESIDKLIEIFNSEGNIHHICPGDESIKFNATEWQSFDEKKQQDILMHYRLAYCGYGEVNWCEALGTVLANDEVVNGVSERGGHPVVKKKLRQWYLRITEYADRLLQGLNKVDFSDAMKEMQTNWIGKSSGAEVEFKIQNSKFKIEVYTTRPDTIFGVDFIVLAPEHELVSQITSNEQKTTIDKYFEYVNSRSDRERQAEKKISGCFTGAYALHPFSNKKIPIWISEYVLAGYGTGAIMAVPCGDERDFKFAQHFNIPITNIIGDAFNGTEANPTKDTILQNSEFLNGMVMREAMEVVIDKLEQLGIGKRKINYKMRDAAFSRQRYWGEPFPIVWKDGIAYALDESELPLLLPEMKEIKPGKDGEGPLANNKEWSHVDLTPNPFPSERGTSSFSMPRYITNTAEQWKVLVEYAKANRKNSTKAEDALWQALRNRKIKNYKFRRQHPVEGYIPDFVCLECKLIVEIDGEYHNEEEQIKIDALRSQWLEQNGYSIIRLTNEDVLNNISFVLNKIEQALSQMENTTPSLKERGLGGEVVRETNTMPGYAGSSWYFLRYMDPQNDEAFCDKKVSDYWNQVDIYVGGTEHAVGHLLYSRMWTKFLHDLGYISFDEPFKKLVNQGMIQGSSRFVYRLVKTNTFVSKNIYLNGVQRISNDPNIQKIVEENRYNENDKVSPELFGTLFTQELHVDVNIVDGVELNIEKFRNWRNGEYKDAILICEDGINTPLSTGGEGQGVRYICGTEVEKMSKSKYNTVNPDDIIAKYGADTFRMYEMFLGPIEQSKPWDTKGIEGVHRFLKKLWRLFYNDGSNSPSPLEKGPGDEAELKTLHRTIKKIEEDTERFSYNTAISAFMVCVNELTELKCHKKEILESLLILLAPYAPHIAEELYHTLTGNYLWQNDNSLSFGEGRGEAVFPKFNPQYLIESTKEYPISINGKTRTTINIALEATEEQVKDLVLSNDIVKKWMEDKPVKKIIFVKGKMVNIVV